MEAVDGIALESIYNLFKQHQMDTKCPKKVSEDNWGSRGRRFKSPTHDNLNAVL